MKTKKVDYNLQNITQNSEAHLSDLFILLYSIFLIDEAGGTPSRYAFNKLFPFIFDELERRLDEGESLHIFNLPFYKMRQGHFNKSLGRKYLKTLKEAGLINAKPMASYELTDRASKIIKQYHRELRQPAENKQFEELVTEFTKKFLEGRSYDEVWSALNEFSHSMLVEDEGVVKAVDNIEVDSRDNTAISYNSEDFKEGKPSDIVTRPYLTLLASELLQTEEPEVEPEELAKVSDLLPQPSGNQA